MSCHTLQQCYRRTSAELALMVNRLEAHADVSPNLVEALKKAQLLLPRPPEEETKREWEQLIALQGEHDPETAFRIWMTKRQESQREAAIAARREESRRLMQPRPQRQMTR